MAPFAERLKRAARAVRGIWAEEPASRAYGLLTGTYGTGGLPPARTAEAYLAAYSTMPWLRAVAGKVSTSVATTVWEAGYRQERVEDEAGAKRWRAVTDRALLKGTAPIRAARRKELGSEYRATPTHPILGLLDAGNPLLTGSAVMQVTQVYLDSLGEAFWLLGRDGAGTPLAIWPLPPTWIRETPDVHRATYVVRYRSWGGEIPATEILWFKHPDPANPYGRGTGIVQALGDELETDEYAAKTVKAHFYHGARPDFVVSPKLQQGEPPPDVKEIKALKERWLSEMQGFMKAGQPYFSTLPIELATLSQSFESMQLTQLREYERNTILQVFGGIPPELLGILDQSNRATIDAADYLYSRYVVQPRQEFLRSMIQTQLVPYFDARLVVDYVSQVSEDRAYQLQVMQAAPASVQVDEWRERAGLAPLDDEAAGAAHLVPLTTEVRADLLDTQMDDPAGDALIAPVPTAAPPPAPEETPPAKRVQRPRR